MKSLIRGIIPEGRVRPGAVFWTTEARAQQYIRDRIAEPIGEPVEAAQAHPAEPAEKKPSSAAPDGRSTDSPKSGEHGTAQPFIASLPGRALSAARRMRSKPRESEAPASSSSTTPT